MVATDIANSVSEGRAALEVQGVSKTYPGTVALNRVSLDIRAGEIHSIVGGNGSGKSTLVKILGGVLPADEGRLVIGGDEYDLADFSPSKARRAGVHVVHQHRAIFDTMTVTENLAIGHGFQTLGGIQIDWKSARRRAIELIERFDLRARPGDLVGDLGPASQTMLEIARALQDQDDASDGVILLDEPTAALPSQEVGLLLDAIRGYQAAGQSIVFISHRLDEVLAISDRVSALRDGIMVGTLDKSELSRESIVRAMVGELVELRSHASTAVATDASSVLDVKALSGGRVNGIDLTVRAGEIVGIAGLAGSGRSTLLRLLFGAQQIESGTITINGVPFAPKDPAAAVRRGVAFVPEDRQHDAVFADMAVTENYTIAQVAKFTRGGRVDQRKERRSAIDAIRSFAIKASSPTSLLSSLSGGNQQKVVLARWMLERPVVLLLDEPTQGVDVRARAEIWQIVADAAADGAAVLVVSSDVEELVHLSSRIIVVRDGQKVSELSSAGITVSEVNTAMHATEEAA